MSKLQYGVFQWIGHLENAQSALKTRGVSIYNFDLKGLKNKKQLLEEIARLLEFPEYFGNNWDALYECLTDLQWLEFKGITLIFENAKGFEEKHPQDFKTLISVLQSAAEFYKGHSKLFMVLVHDRQVWESGLSLSLDFS